MKLPEHCRYSKEHEWVQIDGDMATIGITDHAQEQLGEVVFVPVPLETVLFYIGYYYYNIYKSYKLIDSFQHT